MRKIAICICIVAASRAASAQAPSYRLTAGDVDIGLVTGIYLIEATTQTPLGSGSYYPGPMWLLGGEIDVGLGKNVALQIGLSRTGYENDLYWREAVPHNPYRARADLLSLWGGVRYEFRKPAARIRPYIGGGIVATRFANVERGLKDLCLETCFVMAPELFEGTRRAGFFDGGINFLIRPTWGTRAGLYTTRHPGDESNPNPGLGFNPGGNTVFWHSRLYVGVFYRWK